VLSGFVAGGTYISDIHLGSVADTQVRAFRILLSMFVRGRVHLHFDAAEDVVSALRGAGFAAAEVRPAAELAGEGRDRASRMAHILEASTR
jgi:hypothetical protein